MSSALRNLFRPMLFALVIICLTLSLATHFRPNTEEAIPFEDPHQPSSGTKEEGEPSKPTLLSSEAPTSPPIISNSSSQVKSTLPDPVPPFLSRILQKEKNREGLCRKIQKSWLIQPFGASWTVIDENIQGCEDYCRFTLTDETPSAHLFHCITSSVFTAADRKGVMVGVEPRTFEGGPKCFENPDRGRMDIVGTYNLDSNLPFLYYPRGFWEMLSKQPVPSREEFDKRKGVLFISSNCVDQRTITVQKLMQMIPIESRGNCLNNAPMIPRDSGRDFYTEYKLVIGFDKTDDQDYVSEKLYYPLMYNSLPVYFGSPTARYLLPASSFVDSHDFQGLESLAQHLKRLLEDYDTWSSYFKWREEGHVAEDLDEKMRILDSMGFESRSASCRICDCLCDPECSGKPYEGRGIREAATAV